MSGPFDFDSAVEGFVIRALHPPFTQDNYNVVRWTVAYRQTVWMRNRAMEGDRDYERGYVTRLRRLFTARNEEMLRRRFAELESWHVAVCELPGRED